jgi:DNA-binding response OmpR family regulator
VEVPGQEASRSRILVIDDSITTRTLEEGILRAAGFDVETAADGESGWRLLRERPFQLVVSDVEMPRMDGVELCRAIRADSRLSATPVVLVSGLESAEERARGLEAGADAYLPKSSFDQRDLLDTIHQLLG